MLRKKHFIPVHVLDLIMMMKDNLPFFQEEGGEDAPEFISLLSPEEEEKMNKEDTPEVIPILPLRNNVLFPGVVIPITVGRDKSIQLINEAYKSDKILGVVAQKDSETEDPEGKDLYEFGTVARLIKMLRMPDGNVTAVIQGKRRFQVEEIVTNDPYIKARIEPVEEEKVEEDQQLEATISALKDLAIQIIDLSPNIPSEASIAIRNIDSPNFLVNFISSNMGIEVEDKQSILQTIGLMERAQRVLEFLNKELQMAQLKNQIQSKVKTDIDKQQKDFFLQQQLKAIKEELGHDSIDQEIENLKERGKKKDWPEKVQEQFTKEVEKLQRINPASAEYSVVFNYIDLLLDLPWGEYTKDSLDLERARKVLDKDHFGLDKVKDRILEYLAVLKLKGNMKSPIICLVGPPGVGKTSLGKSIARALKRKYVRMSLGGLRDEAEIRGHRKTYIGAMPGRIIQSLRKAHSSNPVFILDEIDKIGSDFRGDPASALLEVLDPEQNDSFYDYYLELEYDLSHVMFIATANTMNTIHPALRDRMEVIDVNGYLLEEKVEIAKQHLIPKQREMHGLDANNFKLPKPVLEELIEHYTRESGVRSLEKVIASLARHRAKEIVMGNEPKANVKKEDLVEILGPEKFEKDLFRDHEIPGIATGLAWTSVGGDILHIETALSPGKGKVTLTGKLGEVMKESALTALSYLKAHHKEYGIKPEVFNKWDIHVHVPEGAVPKEGPSAGITMLTSLISAFTQRKVKEEVAMTGEATLRGQVLPVGGIKEKILAAKRAGLTNIILSEKNRKDVQEIREDYLEGLTFHYVKMLNEVLDLALTKEKVKDALKINQPDLELESVNGE